MHASSAMTGFTDKPVKTCVPRAAHLVNRAAATVSGVRPGTLVSAVKNSAPRGARPPWAVTQTVGVSSVD